MIKEAGYFLAHTLKALDEHSLHSPSLFNLYKALSDRKDKQRFAGIESLRLSLLKNEEEVALKDFGAGSKTLHSKRRSIAKIAKTSLISPKYGQIIANLAGYIKARKVVELGTCLGLGTLYLAEGMAPEGHIHTFEGANALAQLAGNHLQYVSTKSFSLHSGNIDDTLPEFLREHSDQELFFLDANHTYEATLRYFHWIMANSAANAVLVFDDIHWSEGMHCAWKEIVASPLSGLSIDLFRMGIVFRQSPTGAKLHQIWEI
jgi:predicted O-methyltransferase YrrM